MGLCACGCGKSLEGLRADAKYYSNTCRTRHYRERNGIVTKKPPQEKVCQYKKCGQPIIGRRADAKYCCPNHQKLAFHFRKEARINMLIELMGKK